MKPPAAGQDVPIPTRWQRSPTGRDRESLGLPPGLSDKGRGPVLGFSGGEPPWDYGLVADTNLPEAYWHRYQMAFRGDRQQRLAADEFDWADDEVRHALSEPQTAVDLLVRLAEAAPDDAALAYLGAGPVEELLSTLAAAVVDSVEQAARQSVPFRYALRCAWFDSAVPLAVRDRLRKFGPPP